MTRAKGGGEDEGTTMDAVLNGRWLNEEDVLKQSEEDEARGSAE
jgi:hypothetical protein